jgi:hypothetical protein
MNYNHELTYEEVEKHIELKDGVLYWRRSRGCVKAGKRCGSIDKSSGYRQIKINSKGFLYHRVLWLMTFKEWPKGSLDHIDGNPLHNKIENLRVASASENLRNAARRSDNTSGITGVSFVESNKWRARIYLPGGKAISMHFKHKGAAAVQRKYWEYKFGFHPKHGRPANGLKE